VYAGENFLRVACDPKTPLKKLPVVLDTYELMIFVVFRFEESFFYKYRGSCVRPAEGFNSSRMVIMAMTDDECLDLAISIPSASAFFRNLSPCPVSKRMRWPPCSM
jgi:hypothetical protein